MSCASIYENCVNSALLRDYIQQTKVYNRCPISRWFHCLRGKESHDRMVFVCLQNLNFIAPNEGIAILWAQTETFRK